MTTIYLFLILVSNNGISTTVTTFTDRTACEDALKTAKTELYRLNVEVRGWCSIRGAPEDRT